MANNFSLFDEICEARFLSRPNRFLVLCESKGGVARAFLPNPGRLQELLFPGSTVYLAEEGGSRERKTASTVVAVERDGVPIMLHTHRTNDVARYLVEQGRIPELTGSSVERAEVPVGRSRFDFLLRDSAGEIYLEVKSCTLVGRRVAMFPDAVTARGARHLKELEELSVRRGKRTAVLFVVHWPFAESFMPDYHTDLNFARTLLEVRSHVRIIPVGIEWRWSRSLTLVGEPRRLHIPWDYVEQEARDRGSYLLILHLRSGQTRTIGRLGPVYFREGFYVYVGSAMASLSTRMARHGRLRKNHHWHVDELRAVADVEAILAIRSSVRLECEIAHAVSLMADWTTPGFGSSDCSCDTHLFGFAHNPIQSKAFQGMLQAFRMDRFDGSGDQQKIPLAGARGICEPE